MAFGIVLHRNGWRVHYLGADTPIGDLSQAVREVRPDLAVLAAVAAGRYESHTAGRAHLTAAVPLGLAGAGTTQALAAATGGRLLAGDPVIEAQQAHRRTEKPGSHV